MKTLLIMTLFLTSLTSVLANERIVKRHFMAIADEVNGYYDSDLLERNIRLSVSESSLVDNRGSVVDAIGVPGSITLQSESWVSFYRQGIDVRLLVLHELLRANGINDDNYQVSLPIMNSVYVDDSKARRDKIPFCPLHVSDYKLVEKTRKHRVTGYAAVQNPNIIIFPNPNHDIAIENGLRRAQEECVDKGYESFKATKYGSFRQSSSNSNGFKKSGVEVKIHGICIKMERKSKRRRDLKKERCEKAESCLEMIQNYPFEDAKRSLELKANEMAGEAC